MKLLQDNQGNESSMRAAMMLCVVIGCACILLSVIAVNFMESKIDLTSLSALISPLFAIALGTKAYQKGKEQ